MENNVTSINDILTGENSGNFQKARQPRRFIFPDDHADHPGFRTEWWYFTGNLKTADEREFGYQFTVFRTAIADTSDYENTGSKWSSNQIYMAHAALTDIGKQEYYNDEQFSRAALSLAGTAREPFRVWLHQWSAVSAADSCEGCFNIELSVPARSFNIKLRLNNTQPPFLHGDNGLSAKSPEAGNASYYYSYTRLKTDGILYIDNESFNVSGDSWFDHEWSTSVLGDDQAGWDWFSLQLSDQTEIMLFRLRHRLDPSRDYYYGSLIHEDNRLEVLAAGAFRINSTGKWQSPVTGVAYPSGWIIQLPDRELIVSPKLKNQEFNNSFRYWEGAVDVKGTAKNSKIYGQGYVELTGYM